MVEFDVAGRPAGAGAVTLSCLLGTLGAKTSALCVSKGRGIVG